MFFVITSFVFSTTKKHLPAMPSAVFRQWWAIPWCHLEAARNKWGLSSWYWTHTTTAWWQWEECTGWRVAGRVTPATRGTGCRPTRSWWWWGCCSSIIWWNRTEEENTESKSEENPESNSKRFVWISCIPEMTSNQKIKSCKLMILQFKITRKGTLQPAPCLGFTTGSNYPGGRSEVVR